MAQAPARIALTGGIATGKSTVARLFARRGAVILDADRSAHAVVRPGAPGWQALRRYLGAEFFNAWGELDRRRLREHIVQDAEARHRINRILHPPILQAMEAEWRACRARGDAVLFDIPLLFETGMASRFDVTLLVYAPREIQLQRLMQRDGVTREEAEATLHMQLPIDWKRERADIVIDNGGDLEQTRQQVERLWPQLFG